MGSGLFEGWHIIILAIVLLVLFGARRLPGAAQSLGQSMHIFKRSVQGLAPGDAANPPAADPAGSAWTTPAVTAPPPAADATQQQLADLQRQVADLQRQSAGGNGQPSDAPTTRPI